MYEYVGNLHIHSDYSDGSASIEKIAQAAKRARLDFVGLNDHYHLKPLRDGKEGWRDSVAVLIGCELNQRNNHYLAYNVTEEIPSDTENPQNVIDAVAKQGGLGFIAHPFEKGSPLHDGGHAFTWTRWDAEGYTGISIWNYSSSWKENARNVFAGGFYLYNMRAANIDPGKDILAKWDELTKKRRVVAIGGSDNHGVKIRAVFGLVRGKVFGYRFAFTAVNTHLLLPEKLPSDFEAAKQTIYSALAEGRCFVACGLFEDPRGFRFQAETKNGLAVMGEEVSLSNSPTLHVSVPSDGLITIIHGGRVVKSGSGRELTMAIDEPGAYRAEVRLPRAFGKSRAWIFSNPIYVT